MKIVTAGSSYLDINAYGGCVAYAELLNLQGQPAQAVSMATFNESIPSTVRAWKAPLHTAYTPYDDDIFVAIDVSEPDFLDKFVEKSRVEEVIDHHLGFEKFWHERIGDKAHIEFVGAACTMVYERWVAEDLLEKMSVTSARLLICGILDNTLNFKASVTTERDKVAYRALMKIADLPANWSAQYFRECEKAILSNVRKALRNDTKQLSFKGLSTQPLTVGQLVVWGGSDTIRGNQDTIRQCLEKIQPEWFMNTVSISEGVSYFMSDNDEVKQWAERVLGVKFDDSVAKADRLWLRKEIFKADIEYAKR